MTRNQVQDLIDRLIAKGLSASTVRNSVLPLQAIYRRAHHRQDVAINPTVGLELPTARGRRERVARPHEAARLIAALPSPERALWATALYAGLRRGELQALQSSDVDFERNLIRVQRSWDRVEGLIEPKSRSGTRNVPLSHTLRAPLIELRLRQGGGAGHVFPNRHGDRAFDASTAVHRAKRAWTAAGLSPISLHQCRHTYAAFMIAAGVNAKALSTYMGHSTITVTLDRYGHLMPGAEVQAATMLDAYLTKDPHVWAKRLPTA